LFANITGWFSAECCNKKASLHLSDQESRPEVIYQGLKLCSGIPGGNHYKGKKGRKRRR
jgi:hypothetical protein